MVRKKYAQDYRSETILTPGGHRRTVVTYIGVYYRFAAEPKTVRRMKLWYSILTALSAALWLLLLLANVRPLANSWAFTAPMVIGVAAVGEELMALWRLHTAKEHVTREHNDKLYGRYQFFSGTQTALGLCALAGGIVMLCTNEFSALNLLLCCGAAAWSACGVVMYLLRGNLRMEELPQDTL